ncbi:hypothetical protein LC040_02115 [Bacillus tianshenii]|nr:hypothetical protein LC040_02115 [Bacillus tianshenii]
MHFENQVAKILFVIGCSTIGLGVISGFSFGYENTGYRTEMEWSVFLSWFAAGFISGMLFIGFAEVIHLLHTINKKMNGAKVHEEVAQKDEDDEEEETHKVNWVVSAVDKEKITELYRTENVQEIIPTPFEDYCIVKLRNEADYKIVDVGGFSAIETKERTVNEKVKEWYDKVR